MTKYVAFFEKHLVAQEVYDEALVLRQEWSKMTNVKSDDYLFSVVVLSTHFPKIKNWIEDTLSEDSQADANWRLDGIRNFVIYQKDVLIVESSI